MLTRYTILTSMFLVLLSSSFQLSVAISSMHKVKETVEKFPKEVYDTIFLLKHNKESKEGDFFCHIHKIFYGTLGTGKATAARKIAQEAKVELIEIDIKENLYGNSIHKALNNAQELLKKSEFEALGKALEETSEALDRAQRIDLQADYSSVRKAISKAQDLYKMNEFYSLAHILKNACEELDKARKLDKRKIIHQVLEELELARKLSENKKMVIVLIKNFDKITSNKVKDLITIFIQEATFKHKYISTIVTLVDKNKFNDPNIKGGYREVFFPLPSLFDRKHFIQLYSRQHNNSFSNRQINLTALTTPNFSFGDIENYLDASNIFRNNKFAFPYILGFSLAILSNEVLRNKLIVESVYTALFLFVLYKHRHVILKLPGKIYRQGKMISTSGIKQLSFLKQHKKKGTGVLSEIQPSPL